MVNRPKLKKYFTTSDVEELLKQIDLHVEYIKVKTRMEMCRDPKDNFLISLAIDGKASYLLTGDKDLLELKKIEKTAIITLAEYVTERSMPR